METILELWKKDVVGEEGAYSNYGTADWRRWWHNGQDEKTSSRFTDDSSTTQNSLLWTWRFPQHSLLELQESDDCSTLSTAYWSYKYIKWWLQYNLLELKWWSRYSLLELKGWPQYSLLKLKWWSYNTVQYALLEVKWWLKTTRWSCCDDCRTVLPSCGHKHWNCDDDDHGYTAYTREDKFYLINVLCMIVTMTCFGEKLILNT